MPVRPDYDAEHREGPRSQSQEVRLRGQARPPPRLLLSLPAAHLLQHLATLPRNQVRFAGTQVTVPMLTEPTSTQREAFSLLGTAIPLTLT